MATRTFPIFRSVQRALVGSFGAGKHKPALAAATQIELKEEEIINGGSEERSKGHCRSDGHRLGVDEEDTNGIIIDNWSTWPINSEAARQLRREFVQEGFRKLYNLALGQTRAIGDIGDGDGIQNNSENEGDDGRHDGEEFVAEPMQTAREEPLNNSIAEDETPLVLNGDADWLYYNGDADWMYYAQ